MKRLFWRAAPEALLGVVLLSAGCAPDNKVKPGAPVLKSFSVAHQATGESFETVVDGGRQSVPGFVHVTALFDRLLDPKDVSVLDPDSGVDLGADTATVTATPVAVPAWSSIYTPNGGDFHLAFQPGPNITVSGLPTFPSGASITIVLNKAKIHSKAGEPFTGDGMLADGTFTFETQPFDVSITVPESDSPDGGVDGGPPPVMPMMQAVALAFNNLPEDAIADQITVTFNGTDHTGDVDVTPDPGGNPTKFTVTPKTVWPANTTIVVEVAADAADAVGPKLGAAASATFTTGG
jgi:hypothetical protein